MKLLVWRFLQIQTGRFRFGVVSYRFKFFHLSNEITNCLQLRVTIAGLLISMASRLLGIPIYPTTR